MRTFASYFFFYFYFFYFSNEVQRDYRLWTERTQMEELKRGFRIEINQDILKTVNCSGKK